jgi:hypothetical protein
MEIIDNVNKTVRDNLASSVSKGDRLSIAAGCFSIYAFQALKQQLNEIEELRFIFTSPTFLQEKSPREKREFYIPRLNRERSLYGTEFEIKLRNELTQKAIARECAEWIRQKVHFRSNVTGGTMGGFLTVVKSDETLAYAPINSFTTSDLGCERGNNIMNLVHRIEAPLSTMVGGRQRSPRMKGWSSTTSESGPTPKDWPRIPMSYSFPPVGWASPQIV